MTNTKNIDSMVRVHVLYQCVRSQWYYDEMNESIAMFNVQHGVTRGKILMNNKNCMAAKKEKLMNI